MTIYWNNVELGLSHKDCTSTPNLTLQIEELANTSQHNPWSPIFLQFNNGGQNFVFHHQFW
jgi:hypothetical protein